MSLSSTKHKTRVKQPTLKLKRSLKAQSALLFKDVTIIKSDDKTYFMKSTSNYPFSKIFFLLISELIPWCLTQVNFRFGIERWFTFYVSLNLLIYVAFKPKSILLWIQNWNFKFNVIQEGAPIVDIYLASSAQLHLPYARGRIDRPSLHRQPTKQMHGVLWLLVVDVRIIFCVR